MGGGASGREALDKARDAGSDAKRADQTTSELQCEVARLALICQALWELLKVKARCSEEELLEKIKELDLRDGKLDGQIAVEKKNCTGCGRVNSTRNQRCIYCGLELSPTGAFDGLGHK